MNEKNIDSQRRSRSRHVCTRCRKSLVGLAFHLNRSLREILGDLKWPVILSLFTLNSMTFFIALTLAYYTLPLPLYLGIWPYLLLMESPIIYYVWRRIQHEDSIARVMSERWEGTKTTAELVDEYQKLLS